MNSNNHTSNLDNKEKFTLDLARILLKGPLDDRTDYLRHHLSRAILVSDLEKVNVLLKVGADLTLKNSWSNSPLHEAAIVGHVGVIEALIDAGAAVDAYDYLGNTALHEAAGKGHIEAISILLKHGANVNETNVYGNTPLHCTVFNDKPEPINALIEKGANIDAKNAYGNTPLHLAFKDKKISTVSALLLKNADLNVENIQGHTPLHIVTASHVSQKDLHISLDGKSSEFRSAAKQIVVNEGTIPQSDLITYGRLALVGMTLDGSKYFGTLLHQAIEENNLDDLSILVAARADISAKKENGQTALHAAIIKGNTDMIYGLNPKGAILNSKDKEGNTPLHLAVLNDKTDAARVLISLGADLSVKNNDKINPIEMASSLSKPDLIKLFLANGAIPKSVLPYTTSNGLPGKQPTNKDSIIQKLTAIKRFSILPEPSMATFTTPEYDSNSLNKLRTSLVSRKESRKEPSENEPKNTQNKGGKKISFN